MRRISYKTLLFVALPAFIVMRVGGEWTYVEENLDDLPDQTWVGIGFITSDLGGILLLLALILGGIGLRRSARVVAAGCCRRRDRLDPARALRGRHLGDGGQADVAAFPGLTCAGPGRHG